MVAVHLSDQFIIILQRAKEQLKIKSLASIDDWCMCVAYLVNVLGSSFHHVWREL